MSRLKDPILAILTKVRTELPQFQTVRIWNNQTRHNAEGQYPDFAKPAVFVQVIKNPEISALPDGVSSADLGVVFHIIHEYYDAADGTFEQDLPVFDLRDAVIEAFTLYKAPACGPMHLVTDTQDEDHTNIYEYLVGFVCHFLDTTGMKQYTTANMPNEAIINAQFVAPKGYFKTLIP